MSTGGCARETRRGSTTRDTSGSSIASTTHTRYRGHVVYPGDVERALAQHPAVADAGVVGHDGTGKGFVVLAAGETVSEDELLEFCRARLAAHEVPVIGHVRGPVAAQLRRQTAPARTRGLLGRGTTDSRFGRS